jgi:hypothetical protein
LFWLTTKFLARIIHKKSLKDGWHKKRLAYFS